MSKLFKDRKRLFIIILVFIIGFIAIYALANRQPGELDDFARCLDESGAKFYGAYWCPHCESQKDLFASSAKLLPYVECSKPGGSGTNAICTKAGVQAYPTWVFASGDVVTGEKSLEYLAEKTNCSLPS